MILSFVTLMAFLTGVCAMYLDEMVTIYKAERRISAERIFDILGAILAACMLMYLWNNAGWL